MILAWPGTVAIVLLFISSICNNVFGIPESSLNDGIGSGSANKRLLKRTETNSRRQKRSRADKKDSYTAETMSVECQNSSSAWCRIPAPQKRCSASHLAACSRFHSMK